MATRNERPTMRGKQRPTDQSPSELARSRINPFPQRSLIYSSNGTPEVSWFYSEFFKDEDNDNS